MCPTFCPWFQQMVGENASIHWDDLLSVLKFKLLEIWIINLLESWSDSQGATFWKVDQRSQNALTNK